MENRKSHWENIYSTKKANEVSWTQEVPETSLEFIRGFNCPKEATIIDIGGGDSKLVDNLLEEGYKNITVLDISEKSIECAKKRLGEKSKNVTWIISDINDFNPKEKYTIWHDRAAFHFLTTPEEIENYIGKARQAAGNYLVIGTFSETGPKKCSGIEIKQYSGEQLENQLAKGFNKIKCINEDHVTPFNTKQNFTFCSFKRS
ncbi:MAG TPA: class I SAM-dependent methyltransferase [Bacteroidia bacterium]|jgi:hypothetical protein|nr:class I SAM-dependent methyltransferase [Bacteroidia bacterium]